MSNKSEQSTDATRGLREVLADVRRRIRAYVAVEGVAATVFCLVLAFWLLVGIDWLFEFGPVVRLTMLGAAGFAVLVVCYRKLISRLFVRLADQNLALLMERRFRTFNDALLTSVEFERPDLAGGAKAMFDGALRDAQSRVTAAPPADLFNPRPRALALIGAGTLLATVAVFAAFVPDLLALGFYRVTGQRNDPWPRRTHLSIEGFRPVLDEKTGQPVNPPAYQPRKVARGSDVDLVVLADAQKHVPEVVYLRYVSADGRAERELIMQREGVAKAGVEPYQRYKLPVDSGALRGISTSLTIDVRGGDGRVRDLEIVVVDRPTLTVDLDCTYPKYTGLSPQTKSNVGAVETIEQNTVVTVRCTSDKPLERVVVVEPRQQGDVVKQTIDLTAAADNRSFTYEVGPVAAQVDLAFKLLDTDEIDNVVRLRLNPKNDGPPKFKSFARRGIGDKVTPQAELPFVGEVTDDYGLTRLWFAYSTGEGASLERDIAAGPEELRAAATVNISVPVASLVAGDPQAQIGKQLKLQAKARDNRELDASAAGQIADGDTFVFDVVSDAEVLQDLRAREKELREQFKALIAKLVRDREAVRRMGERPSSAPKPGEPAVNSAKIAVHQARLHTKENKEETARVAASFSGMVEEIANNHIGRVPASVTGDAAAAAGNADYGKLLQDEAEKLSDRYAIQIAGPLNRLLAQGPAPAGGGQPSPSEFETYEALLATLLARVSEQQPDKAELDAARTAVDLKAGEIIARMNDVLTIMEKMKSFDETVAMLRNIIALQKEIRERTEAGRNDPNRLRNLGKKP